MSMAGTRCRWRVWVIDGWCGSGRWVVWVWLLGGRLGGRSALFIVGWRWVWSWWGLCIMAVVRVVVVAAVVVVAVFFFKCLVATCRWVRLISRRWKSSRNERTER